MCFGLSESGASKPGGGRDGRRALPPLLSPNLVSKPLDFESCFEAPVNPSVTKRRESVEKFGDNKENICFN